MPAHIRSAALYGIEALPVDVEVDVLPGLPSFNVVGLPDKSIQESRERLTAALMNAGFTPPRRKTIVSLAPASLKKEGSLYDLPITLGYLVASKQLGTTFSWEKAWFAGELGLDGTIRSIKGVLPIALAAARRGITDLYIPAANIEEASPLSDQVNIYGIENLQQLLTHLVKPEAGSLQASVYTESTVATETPEIDFQDVYGQDHAKRALMIAASGGHNVLLIGPPGTGKTLLARALVGILPPLQREEAYTVTSLYSIAGLLPGGGLMRQRPFRSPHHGASSAALVGGGGVPRPGEISLAHHGILFLDELPEFSRTVLEQLRQPLEEGMVTIARAAHSLRFPARAVLVAAMNPCPCGFYGSQQKDCSCAPHEISRYQQRISGPLLDRIDLHVLVSDVPVEQLLQQKPTGQSSQNIAVTVTDARSRQWQRQHKTNSELKSQEIQSFCPIDAASKQLLTAASKRFRLSARGIHRLLKVALTIADLEGAPRLLSRHVAEALQYREQLAGSLPDFL